MKIAGKETPARREGSTGHQEAFSWSSVVVVFSRAPARRSPRARCPRKPFADSVQLPFANGERPLIAFPQKRPLIVLTPRPPQLETPFAIFDQGVYTPNDAFFVRWHLPNIPQEVDATAHRIAVSGEVNRVLSLSLDDLASMPQVEIAAVNQCSGNSRGLSAPRVPAASGRTARWATRCGPACGCATCSTARAQGHGEAGAVRRPRPRHLSGDAEVSKSLDIDVARGDDVIVAYAMNGQPLPVLNGYPCA